MEDVMSVWARFNCVIILQDVINTVELYYIKQRDVSIMYPTLIEFE